MAKTMRTETAGDLVIVTMYPILSRWDGFTVRREKRKQSTLAKQYSNDKRMFKKAELLLAANFRDGDIFATLTFDDAHLPRNRAECQKDVRKFHKRMRLARKAGGLPYKYIYCLEHKHGDREEAMNRRWHMHLVLNATGDDYDTIRRCWEGGRVQAFSRIEITREHSWEALARYLTKERRDDTDQNVYACSRGLAKPETDVRRVPNDEQAAIPPGAVVLFDSGPARSAYGEWRVVKYMFHPAARAPKAKRRKRRQTRRGQKTNGLPPPEAGRSKG